MPRDCRDSLTDILNCISKIEEYVEGISPVEFSQDEKTQDAVIRNLEVIGEAVKNIPNSIQEEHTSVPWKEMAGLRDVLIHNYFGIDLGILEDIVYVELPRLKDLIKAILDDLAKKP